MFEIEFWGVRGSVATAGPTTARVGGHTSCVEVRCGETSLVLDAGTGLHALGRDLLARADRPSGLTVHLLLSHYHWDHIQAFPFFAPVYGADHRIEVYGPDLAGAGPAAVREVFAAQMRAPFFPVGLEAVRARLGFHGLPPDGERTVGAARIRTAAANHPNGCLAYRIEHEGRSVVYATDTEHVIDGPVDESLRALAEGADVLIYDAQYTPEEHPQRRGWGHSTAEAGARLAREAGVGQLVLFHHDPAHDDRTVARIEARTRGLFSNTVAAREGLVLTPGRAAGAPTRQRLHAAGG
jgi:phosphoribosyl 1,2-cyclic phosphodiesterase